MFVANRGFAIFSSRKEILQQFIEMNWKVIIVTSDDEYSQLMVKLGVILEPVNFKNTHNLNTLCKLALIIRKYKPDLVHNFHSKPIILSSIISRLLLGQSTRIVNTITGLGRSIPSSGFSRFLSIYAYKLACWCSDKVIFQNHDDRMFFICDNVCGESKAELIISAGVDAVKFPYSQRRLGFDDKPVVVMAGRILKSKGVNHFINIAEQACKIWPNIKFFWAGEADVEDPDKVQLHAITKNSHVDFVGNVEDIYSFLKKADVMVFPSYYREGVPRAVLESASSGMPVIAYDVPGVREAVIDKRTGILVSPVSSELMGNALVDLLYDDQLRQKMGVEARKMIMLNFQIESVHKKYFNVYRDVGALK